MDKFGLYQECLARSVEQLNNADAQCRNYIKKLVDMKVNYIAKHIIGKKYYLYDLLNKDNYRYKYYEPGQYKAVLIESTIESYDFSENIFREDNKRNYLVSICVHFMRDPEAILKGKIKLTDKEKSILKEMLNYWNTKDGENRKVYSSQKNPEELNRDLSYLKHGLYVSIDLSWKCNLDDILKDNFITRGIKAEASLFI